MNSATSGSAFRSASRAIVVVAMAMALGACTKAPVRAEQGSAPGPEANPQEGTSAASAPAQGQAVAVFAGGCFWCVESAFEPVEGVTSVVSGYTGGSESNPSYEDVSHHRTSHLEAVRVVYDPEQVRYEELLEVFWHNIDPTQDNGQFCDRGNQYRSAIFVQNETQRTAAEASLLRVEARLGQDVVTSIRDAATFWVAEDYHQDYYRTHARRYRLYRQGCGRDARLRELWGSDAAGSH